MKMPELTEIQGIQIPNQPIQQQQQQQQDNSRLANTELAKVYKNELINIFKSCK